MKHLRSCLSRGAGLRLALILGGAGLLAFGVLRGENRTILQKAIYICLECIGIG